MKIKIIVIINLFVLFVIILSGLYPFEFKPANKVFRNKTSPGIIIHNNGMVCEENHTYNSTLLSSISSKREFSIELLLRSTSQYKYGFSTILSLYDDTDPEIYKIARWKTNLVLRRRISLPNGKNSYHEIFLKDALKSENIIFLSIAMGKNGSTVYINGENYGFLKEFTILTNNRTIRNSHMMIGNNPEGNSSWDGEINGLALYNRTLNQYDAYRHRGMWAKNDYNNLSKEPGIFTLYPMNEKTGRIVYNRLNEKNNMIIPKKFFVIKKSILSKPWLDFWKDRLFYLDFISNFIGFIPVGFFLMLLLITLTGTNRILILAITIIIGSGLSLSIELIQVFMPARTSSMTDLISNICGTAMGIFIFHLLYNTKWLKINDSQ